MMDTAVATYGEENRLWTGDEARAFARVVGGAVVARGARRDDRDAPVTGERTDGRDHPRPARPDQLRPPATPRSSPEVIVGDQIVVAGGLRARGPDPGGQVAPTTRSRTSTGRMLALRAGDVLAGHARHPARAPRLRRRGARRTSPSATRSRCSTSAGSSGSCTSVNPDIGPPFQAEVLGADPRVSRAGRPRRPARAHPRPRGAAGRHAGEPRCRWSTWPAPA